MNAKRVLQSIALPFLFFCFYAYHSAPGVTVEDSGDFLSAGLSLGIAHPPGYPLYTLLAFLVSKLPFLDGARAINLMSALFAALSLAVAFSLARKLSKQNSPMAAVAAVTALGFHPFFWSQAEIAEVYTLNIFLTLATYWVVLNWSEWENRVRPVIGLGLLIGLGLANHYPLYILAVAPLAYWVIDRHRDQLGERSFFLGMVGLAVGLTPYLYLVISALWRDPVYNFGKLKDLDMVWDHILRYQYRGIDNAGGELSDKLGIFFHVEWEALKGFLLFAPVLILGIWNVQKTGMRSRWLIHWAAIATSLGLALLLGFPDDERHRAIFQAYMGPSIVFQSFYLIVGFDFLMLKRKIVVQAIGIFTAVAALGQAIYFLPSVSHRGDIFVDRWSRALLESMEPDSKLILCGTDVLAVNYMHQIQGVRSDLKVYDEYSLFTRDNLFAPQFLFQAEDPMAVRKGVETRVATSSEVPVYFLCSESPKELGIPYKQTLYLYRAGGSIGTVPQDAAILDEQLWIAAVNGWPKQDYWLDKRRSSFFYQALQFGAESQLNLVPPMVEWVNRSGLVKSYDYVLAIGKALTDKKVYEPVYGMLKSKEQRFGRPWLHPDELSLYCGLELKYGTVETAEALCKDAISRTGPCLAAAHDNLALIYRSRKQLDEMREQAQLALKCRPGDPVATQILGQ